MKLSLEWVKIERRNKDKESYDRESNEINDFHYKGWLIFLS